MDQFIPVCEPLLAGKEEAYVLDAVRRGWISSGGDYVRNFEEGFASYCGAKYGVSVSNGTVALHLALLAAGVGEGDEVILPDFTMIACLSAVLYCRAKPVFVDCEDDTLNMDPKQVKAKITSRTKVIMPVHIFGHPVDMDSIREIASQHNILVVEDSAEAHGAELKGKRCGSLGDISTFSFFANKILTTGEGGMVLTSDDETHRLLRYFRNLCFKVDGPRDYLHDDLGFNYRFTNLQAAVGVAQLEKLDDYVAMRRQNAKLYSEKLESIPGLILPVERADCKSVYWMYGIRLCEHTHPNRRDEVMKKLKEKGIDTRLYFKPMHSQPLLKKLGHLPSDERFPVTDSASRSGFYLPSSSGLTEEQIDFIYLQLKDILS